MPFNLVLRSDQQQHHSSQDSKFLSELNVALMESDPPPTVGRRVFANESVGAGDLEQLYSAAGSLQATLASVVASLNLGADLPGFAKKAVKVAETAAVMGALGATSAKDFVGGARLNFNATQTNDVFPVAATGVPNYLGRRAKDSVLVAEAFDNRETRSAVLYTMAYNYTLARQDEWGETIWPTLTLPADQVGFGIIVNRLTVYRGATHSTSGDRGNNFNKVDLMRAARDYKVLQKEKTRIYPVYRDGVNNKHFVDPTLVAPANKDVDGVPVFTAPLSMNVEHDIVGLSQTDASLQGGIANQTDTLDPTINVEFLYLKFGDDVIKVNTYAHPSSNFVAAPQGLDKQRNLNFYTKGITIGANTLQNDGGALVSLKALKDNKLTMVLELNVNGMANTEYNTVKMFPAPMQMLHLVDEHGVVLPDTDPTYQDIAPLVAGGLIIGADLRSWKTNINMRDRGDFIDRSSFTQLYEIPLLSPVTAQRPQSSDGQLDAGDFEALVTTTRFRLMNDGVTALFDAFDQIKEFAENAKFITDRPSYLGASRFHVQPTVYDVGTLDLSGVVDSLNSTDRPEDLANAIINVIRDYAFRMYVESEYPAAQAALGMTDQVTVVVATDPIIHRYIMLKGDLRTLTEKFNVKIVSNIDKRMDGKMFITFGVFDENRNQAPNILNFGNLVWAPEVVMSASVPRGESMSRETIVQPRYRFIWHCPIITKITLDGIPKLMLKKLPIKFDDK